MYVTTLPTLNNLAGTLQPEMNVSHTARGRKRILGDSCSDCPGLVHTYTQCMSETCVRPPVSYWDTRENPPRNATFDFWDAKRNLERMNVSIHFLW